MGRVVAIGIDAAEWQFLRRWMDDGHLPWLRTFVDRAVFCELENVPYYRSEYVWTQLVTGQPFEATGYWTMGEFDPRTYRAYDKGAYLGAPFYAGTGVPSIIFDAPQLAIAEDVEGIQITAWGAHGPHYPRASQPIGLLTQLDEEFGPHPAFGNDFDTAWFVPSYIDALADQLLAGAETRLEIARRLMAERPDWQFFLTSMSELHSAGHHFWHAVDERHPLHDQPTAPLARRRLLEVVDRIDAAIGRFIDSLGDDVHVLVFALHGMFPADDAASMVLVPELFARLETGRRNLRVDGDADAWRRAGCPPVVPASSKPWAANTWMHDRFVRSLPERIRALARRSLPPAAFAALKRLAGRGEADVGLTPVSVPAEVRVPPAEIAARRLMEEGMEWQPADWYRDLWPTMRYFALPTFTDVHIRVNLRGRERDGIVDPADYEAVCDEAVAELRRMVDPRTGDCPVADVFHPRRDDPWAEVGPDCDVIVTLMRALDAIEHPEVGMLGPVPFLRTGAHTANGFVALRSPAGSPLQLARRPAADLAMTIMHLLDIDPPVGAEGVAITAEVGDRSGPHPASSATGS